MDNRAIAVFDSGLGGLTAMRRLVAALPEEDIIYLGDTGRVPYGGRSIETIIKYTREDISFLLRHDIKAILVACGTVSTTALDVVRGDYDVPIYGVLAPSAEKAVSLTKNGKIGVIATAASIAGGAYGRKIRELMPGAEVTEKACPLFVPLVESGRINRGDVVIETVAREYLEPLKKTGIDTLVLGCTHYPLLTEIIRDVLGDGVSLVDSGGEAAASLARELADNELLGKGGGTHRYYVTDGTENFAKLGSLFLGEDIRGEVSRVSLSAI